MSFNYETMKQFIQEHMATYKIYTKILTNKTNVFKAQEAQRLLGQPK